MDRKEVDEKVRALLVEHLGVVPEVVVDEALLVPENDGKGRVNRESVKPNLGADSLDVVEIVMALEDDFDIEIPDEEAQPLNDATVAELIEFVVRKVGATEAPAQGVAA
jgi:acyl carrier protein